MLEIFSLFEISRSKLSSYWDPRRVHPRHGSANLKQTESSKTAVESQINETTPLIDTVVMDVYHYAFKSTAHTELPINHGLRGITMRQCGSISGARYRLWWRLLITEGAVHMWGWGHTWNLCICL